MHRLAAQYGLFRIQFKVFTMPSLNINDQCYYNSYNRAGMYQKRYQMYGKD